MEQPNRMNSARRYRSMNSIDKEKLKDQAAALSSPLPGSPHASSTPGTLKTSHMRKASIGSVTSTGSQNSPRLSINGNGKEAPLGVGFHDLKMSSSSSGHTPPAATPSTASQGTTQPYKADDIDQSVLAELPPEIQKEILGSLGQNQGTPASASPKHTANSSLAFEDKGKRPMQPSFNVMAGTGARPPAQKSQYMTTLSRYNSTANSDTEDMRSEIGSEAGSEMEGGGMLSSGFRSRRTSSVADMHREQDHGREIAELKAAVNSAENKSNMLEKHIVKLGEQLQVSEMHNKRLEEELDNVLVEMKRDTTELAHLRSQLRDLMANRDEAEAFMRNQLVAIQAALKVSQQRNEKLMKENEELKKDLVDKNLQLAEGQEEIIKAKHAILKNKHYEAHLQEKVDHMENILNRYASAPQPSTDVESVKSPPKAKNAKKAPPAPKKEPTPPSSPPANPAPLPSVTSAPVSNTNGTPFEKEEAAHIVITAEAPPEPKPEPKPETNMKQIEKKISNVATKPVEATKTMARTLSRAGSHVLTKAKSMRDNKDKGDKASKGDKGSKGDKEDKLEGGDKSEKVDKAERAAERRAEKEAKGKEAVQA